jgi:thymidylate kinase
MGNFVVFEGICCSGKTTICRMLGEKLMQLGYQVVHNHGAFTYTELGGEFKELTVEKDFPITTLYYFVDLLINTQKFIKPNLSTPNAIILQDRYHDSITTYIKAYGEYCGRDYDVYRVPDVLIQENYLIKPAVKIFCVPPYEIIIGRMEESKTTTVHDYYRQHPRFLKMAYNELEKKANDCVDSIIINTSSDSSIHNGIEKILTLIDAPEGHKKGSPD